MEVLGRFKGEVIKYDVSKGFGFVKVTEIFRGESLRHFSTSDAFIHHKEIKEHTNGSGIAKLQIGEAVIFTVHKTDNGNRAADLRVIGKSEEFVYDEEIEEENFNTSEAAGGYDVYNNNRN